MCNHFYYKFFSYVLAIAVCACFSGMSSSSYAIEEALPGSAMQSNIVKKSPEPPQKGTNIFSEMIQNSEKKPQGMQSWKSAESVQDQLKDVAKQMQDLTESELRNLQNTIDKQYQTDIQAPAQVPTQNSESDNPYYPQLNVQQLGNNGGRNASQSGSVYSPNAVIPPDPKKDPFDLDTPKRLWDVP